MAKRKKGYAVHTSRKRPKQHADSQQEYKIKNILDETKTHYLIDWENSKDGEVFAPTWEPKHHANELAVTDWEAQKAAQAAGTGAAAPLPIKRRQKIVVDSSPEQGTSHQRPEVVRARYAVIEGSSQAPRDDQSATAATDSNSDSGTERQPLEIGESQPELGAENSQLIPGAAGTVTVEAPPSSFEAGDYQEFSSSQQLSESTDVPSELSADNLRTGDAVTRPATDSSLQRPQTGVEVTAEPSVSSQQIEVAVETSSQDLEERRGVPVEQVEPYRQLREIAARVASLFPLRNSDRVPAELPEASPNLDGPDGVPASAPALPQLLEPSGASSESQPSRQIREGAGAALAAEYVQESEERVEALPDLSEQSLLVEEPATTIVAEDADDQQVSQAESISTTPALTTNKVIPDSQTIEEPSTLLEDTGEPVLQNTISKTPAQAEAHGQQTSPSSAETNIPQSTFPFRTQILAALTASSLPAPSPLASVPSRLLGEFGESAPPRPCSPSSSFSADFPMAVSHQSSSSSESLAFQLKAIRDKHRPPPQGTEPPLPGSPVAKLRAEEEIRRSPSAVPAVEPAEATSQEEMNTSERYETLVPQANDEENSINEGTGAIRAGSAREKNPSPGSHIIPIALLGHQRDQYPATVYYHKDFIQRFLAQSHPSPELTTQAELFVERMRRIALHPDLDNAETFTQYDVEPQRQAQWDIDCSAKFRFLKHLFDPMRDHSVHIAVVATDMHTIQMLETFLLGLSIPHRRSHDTDNTGLDNDHAGLLVTLVNPSDEQASQPQSLSSPADLLIAISANVGDHTQLKHRLGQDCPLLVLVVPCTVEHIEFSLSPSLSPAARLRALVSGIYQLRNDAGKLEEDQLPLDVAAPMIAQYLQEAAGDSQTEFPVAELMTLQNLDSQTESDVSSAGQKRAFDSDEGIDSNKRMRTAAQHATVPELPTTINPQEIEITHVSDSVKLHRQSQPSSFSETEQQLQKLLETAQQQNRDYVAALSDLQYRHEEQREQLINVTNERDEAIATAQRALKRYTEAADANSKLKASRTELQEQLDAANARLLKHEIPERAELEAARLAEVQAEAEQLRLQDRLDKIQTELDYTRSLYQTASQSASGLASQTTELESRLALTQTRASGEQVKLRQMGADAQTRNLRAENKRLKAVLADREAGMRTKDEEIARLKEASRGRMGTRGASVPRTPRVGSPIKSRQGSPAAGEVKGVHKGAHLHPLRNG